MGIAFFYLVFIERVRRELVAVFFLLSRKKKDAGWLCLHVRTYIKGGMVDGKMMDVWKWWMYICHAHERKKYIYVVSMERED